MGLQQPHSDTNKKMTRNVLDHILNRVETTSHARPTSSENRDDNRENRTLRVLYIRGVSKKIDKLCWSNQTVNIREVFKPVRTIRQMVAKVKNRMPKDRMK